MTASCRFSTARSNSRVVLGYVRHLKLQLEQGLIWPIKDPLSGLGHALQENDAMYVQEGTLKVRQVASRPLLPSTR